MQPRLQASATPGVFNMVRITLLILAFLATTAFSQERGRVVIVGTGEASHAPEYATLRMTVTSLCYETLREAKEANAALARDLLGILQRFAVDPRSRVTAVGGPSVRQNETISVRDQIKVLCQMKWRVTNTLKIETPALTTFGDLEDQLLVAIDQAAPQGADPSKVAQSFADLSTPEFNVYDETLLSLRTTAQQKAFADAKGQFRVFAAACPLADVHLAKISPPRQEVRYQYARMGFDESSPLIPEQVSVKATWEFEWSFLANQECVTKRRPES